MNTTATLIDDDLDVMLARRGGDRVPPDLVPSICRAVAEAPSRPRPLHSLLAPPPMWAPALRVAWVVVAVGILLAATVSAVLVGSELLRRSSDLSIVPPSDVPVPTAATAPTIAPQARAIRPVDQVNALAFASDGSIWLATGAGVVHWNVAANAATLYGQPAGLPTTEAIRLAIAPDGTVWAAGAAWLARYEQDGTWTTFTQLGDAGAPQEIGGIAFARDGALVTVATGNNASYLLRYDGTWSSITIGVESGSIQGGCSRVGVGQDGMVWVGSCTDGVLAWDGSRWTRYGRGSDGLPDTPWLTGVAGDGAVWVEFPAFCESDVSCSDAGDGVARLEAGRWTVWSTGDGLVSPDASPVLGPLGTAWATSSRAPGKVSRFDGARWTTTDAPGISGARALATASDGALWLTAPGGLLRYDGSSLTRHALPASLETVTQLPALEMTPTASVAVVTTPSALGTIDWHTFESPPGRYFWGVVGTPHGPVVVDGNDLRWLASDGTWSGTTLPIRPWRVTAVGDRVVAHGHGAVWLRWEASRWVVDETLDLPASFAMIGQVAAGPHGTIVTAGTKVAYASDGLRFTPAAISPDPALLGTSVDSEDVIGCAVQTGSWPGEGSLGPVLATATGFVAFTPADPANWNNSPLCEPVPWFSEDGSTWRLVTRDSPFGKGAVVVDMANRDGRYVAVGAAGSSTAGSPTVWAVWVSDDGLSWERLPSREKPEPCSQAGCVGVDNAVLGEVAAGPEGWMVVAWDGTAWTSGDGRSWQLLHGWPGIRGGYMTPAVALSPGVIVASGSLPGPWHQVVVVGTVRP